MANKDSDNDEDKFNAPADWDGPVEDRHCTDILLLILLWCMWIAMTGIGLYATTQGDYRWVVNPLDYDGNICGTDFGEIDMREFTNLYLINNFGGGVCVRSCPTVSLSLMNDTENDNINNNNNTSSDVFTLITYSGVYQHPDSTPLLLPDFIDMADYSNASDAISCTPDRCFPDPNDPSLSWNSVGISQGFGFAYYAGDTFEVLLRCQYTIEASNEIRDAVRADEQDGLFPDDDIYDFFNKLYADIYTARFFILGFGFGFALAFSLLYIFLMRIPFLLKIIVWTSILLTIILFAVGGYYLFNLAQDYDDEDPQTQDDVTIQATRIAGIVMWVISAVLFVLACCLRKQIAVAIACVKVAGKAVNHMFLILLVPVAQGVGYLSFLILWLVYAVYLASLGEITTREIPLSTGDLQITVREYEFDEFVTRCGWFLLFCLFWTSNFIVAVGDMTIALAVSRYYFTRNRLFIGSWTVIHAMWQVIYYHSGTCAYGSLLIAIVQVIRAVIAKAQRAAKKADNKLAQCLLCCCQCCFSMMECCLKFISKNAYIQTAIFSTAFCKSCRKAFFLILRNAARIAAINYVSGAVLIIGKLFIASVVTLFSYYLIVENIQDDLNSTTGPTVIIFLISYWISDMFMDVYDMAINTVLHCFIADEEMFTDQVYADSDLKSYIDEHGAEKE